MEFLTIKNATNSNNIGIESHENDNANIMKENTKPLLDSKESHTSSNSHLKDKACRSSKISINSEVSNTELEDDTWDFDQIDLSDITEAFIDLTM